MTVSRRARWLARRGATRAGAVAVAVLLATPGAPAAPLAPATAGAAQAEGGTTTSTSTTTAPSPEDDPAPASTTTSAPDEGTTSSTSTSSTTSTTSTTATGAAGSEEEPLPPASVELLPPEETLPPVPPPAVPPAPPPGADESGRRRAQAELRAAELALKKARAAEAAMVQRVLVPAQRRMDGARAAVDALGADERAAVEGLAAARTKMKRMAVAGYVNGGDTQPVDYLLRAADPIDLERRRTIIRTATEARRAAVEEYAAAQVAATARLEQAVREVQDAEVALAAAHAEVDAAAMARLVLDVDVAEKRELLDHTTASALVGGTDIPRLFADAYRRAAAALGKRAPHCRVSWMAIAAIGKVESNHGRYRGAQFALNGDVFPRILGIPLDGTRSALIRDTDAGALDTDLEFDRAVGPMQFIPSTWIRINEDGNGDGVRDPNNIYDAALGTAAYLCRAVRSGGLDTDEGLRPAFFSYNHSDAYVEKVLGWAHAYGAPVTTPPPPPPPAAPVPGAAPATAP